jgi:hypothetical protein
MFFRYIVMAGSAPDARMCRQLIFCRIDIEVNPSIKDSPSTVAVKTFAVRRILRRRYKNGQERRCK